MSKRIPLTILGHVVGTCEVGEARQDLYGLSHDIKNLVLLPDDKIPAEAKPYVQMILATAMEGLVLEDRRIR